MKKINSNQPGTNLNKVFSFGSFLFLISIIILILISASFVLSASIVIEDTVKVKINATYEVNASEADYLKVSSGYPTLMKDNQTFSLRTHKFTKDANSSSKVLVIFSSVPISWQPSGTYIYTIRVQDRVGNARNDSKIFQVVNPPNQTINNSVPEYCMNAQKDVNETDVDCGNVCPPCDIGKNCLVDSDCFSMYCLNGICSQPSCTDNVKNGLESDVDCGGDCPGCALNQNCNKDMDCISRFCNSDNKCDTASCTDNVQNGDETGVDCGGGCPDACPTGSGCISDSDCESGNCEAGVCTVDRYQDTDEDGMPDWWEEKYNLNPNDSSDADEDADGDGFSNLDEYLDGTDPRNPHDPEPKKKRILQIILLILGLLLIIGSTGFLIYSRLVLIPQQEAEKRKAMSQKPGVQRRPSMSMHQRPALRRPLRRPGVRQPSSRRSLLGAFGKEAPRKQPGAKTGENVRAKSVGRARVGGFVPLSNLGKKPGGAQTGPAQKKPLAGSFSRLRNLSQPKEQPKLGMPGKPTMDKPKSTKDSLKALSDSVRKKEAEKKKAEDKK